MVFKSDTSLKADMADKNDKVKITDGKYLGMSESYVFWVGFFLKKKKKNIC